MTDYEQWRCAACGQPSGSQGHNMRDPETDEYFFSCQEPERRERALKQWFEAWKPKT